MIKLTVNVHTRDADWKEEQHKRDHGKFSSTGGSGAAPEKPAEPAEPNRPHSHEIAAKFKSTANGNPYKAQPHGSANAAFPSFRVAHKGTDMHHNVTLNSEGKVQSHYVNKGYTWMSVKGKKGGYHTTFLKPEESAKYPAVHAAIQEHLTGKKPDVDPKAEHSRVATELKKNLKYTQKQLWEAQHKMAKAHPSSKSLHEPYVAEVEKSLKRQERELAEHTAAAPVVAKPSPKPAKAGPSPSDLVAKMTAKNAETQATEGAAARAKLGLPPLKPAAAPPVQSPVHEHLRPDPGKYKHPNDVKWMTNRLKEADAAAAHPTDPHGAISALKENASYPRFTAYKKALLAHHKKD